MLDLYNFTRSLNLRSVTETDVNIADCFLLLSRFYNYFNYDIWQLPINDIN